MLSNNAKLRIIEISWRYARYPRKKLGYHWPNALQKVNDVYPFAVTAFTPPVWAKVIRVVYIWRFAIILTFFYEVTPNETL